MEKIETGWVDIIIPFYNSSKYILETLDSIENQTYDKIKIICVDNNSMDNSVQVVKLFAKKSRFEVVLTSEEKPNASAARNTGYSISKGEFVSFLDSDDKISIDKIAKQVQYLVENPKLDCVISDRVIYNEDFSEIVEFKNFDSCVPFKLEDFITNIFITGNPLYTKNCIDNYGVYNDDLIVGQDWEFHLRLAKKGCRFGYLKGDFLKCRNHDLSLSSNWKEVSVVQEHILMEFFSIEQILIFQNSTREYAFHMFYNNAIFGEIKDLKKRISIVTRIYASLNVGKSSSVIALGLLKIRLIIYFKRLLLI